MRAYTFWGPFVSLKPPPVLTCDCAEHPIKSAEFRKEIKFTNRKHDALNSTGCFVSGQFEMAPFGKEFRQRYGLVMNRQR